MAQSVAHSLWERGVASSSLAIPTIKIKEGYFSMYLRLIFIITFTYVVSFYTIQAEYISNFTGNVSDIITGIEQKISQEIHSNDIFLALSLEEKQLFLNALMNLFIDSFLTMEANRLKRYLVCKLQEKSNIIDNSTEITTIAEQLKKVCLLRCNYKKMKENCFTYIEQNFKSVDEALEHVKNTGRQLMTHIITEMRYQLDTHHTALSTTLKSTINRFLSLQKNFELPLDECSNKNIPLCIREFDRLIGFYYTLESTCNNLQQNTSHCLDILHHTFEFGLQLVNAYYKAIYKQVAQENIQNEFLIVMFNIHGYIQPENRRIEYLPADLMEFKDLLVNQIS